MNDRRFEYRGTDARLRAFLEWVDGHRTTSLAKKILEEGTGTDLKKRAFYRVVSEHRWDRSGEIRDAWLAHPDSGLIEPAPVRDDARHAPAAGEALDSNKSLDGGVQPDAASGDDRAAAGLGVNGQESGDSGRGGESEPGEEDSEDAAWVRQCVLQAETREEIASAVGAPVLREDPGLSLEDARACALLTATGYFYCTSAKRYRTSTRARGVWPSPLRTPERMAARTAHSRCATASA